MLFSFFKCTPQPIIGEVDPPPVSAPTHVPVPTPIPALVPLRTYTRRVMQTIDKVIPATSHPPLITSALDDLPIALLRETLAHPGWKVVMNEEMQILSKNGTWNGVPTPPGQSCVSCRWIYTIKHNPDGPIERLKARLVARGFTQQHGIDYEEIFSPVAKLNTVRVFISLTVHRSWPLYQLDIKIVFLHGDMTETVYMFQHPGYETAGENHVCRLRKSLYGLKQSPQAWFEKFSKVVQAIGFSRSSVDSSIFVHRRSRDCDITCLR
ncbi:Retrovirus-related Pol polyprotein from transposon RE1-like protein [Drosera capensis]